MQREMFMELRAAMQILASTFQNHVGESLLSGMGQGESYIFRAEARSDVGGGAVEFDGGALSFGTDNFDVAPTDAVTPSGAEGLHAGFFGGKARGVAFES